MAKRKYFNIFIDGNKVATKNAWNSARRQGIKELSQIMNGSKIHQIDYHITSKDSTGHQEGCFIFESDIGQVKEFYIKRDKDK